MKLAGLHQENKEQPTAQSSLLSLILRFNLLVEEMAGSYASYTSIFVRGKRIWVYRSPAVAAVFSITA